MRSYQTQGVILRRSNYGEADKILVIYSQHYGKIKALAKGVRRTTSRKGGNLELFNQAALHLTTGHSLDLVTEAQVIDSFRSWRTDLKHVAVGYYFCELIDLLTPWQEPNFEVYSLLTSTLGAIGTSPAKAQVRAFEERLLDLIGFGVPADLRRQSDSLRPYIESIIEKKINSPKILRDLYTKG